MPKTLAAMLALVLVTLCGAATAGELEPATGWAPADVPPTLLLSAVELNCGEILLISAEDAYLYEPVSDTWRPTGARTASIRGGATVKVPGGRVLVVGGESNSTTPVTSSSVEEYDPTTGAWSAIEPMMEARLGHTATRLDDGRVLVAGGSATPAGAPSWTAEIYDTTTGWEGTGSLRVGRSGHTATGLADGRVLVVGGLDGAAATAEIYDPTTGLWSDAAAPLVPRTFHTATLLQNGRVLVTGGASSWSEIYDPISDLWADTRTMHDLRNRASATRLADGRVLVAGGSLFGPLDTVELFDPAANDWSDGPPMVAARSTHAALLLDGGEVLVVGGTFVQVRGERFGIRAPRNLFSVDDTDDTFDALPGDGACDDGTGRCTLRAAVMEANALTGDERIELPPGDFSLYQSGAVEVDGSVAIAGAGASRTIIEGNGADPIFRVLRSASADISALTVENHSTGPGIVSHGRLELSDCTVRASNQGILAEGRLIMHRCTVRDNTTALSPGFNPGAGLRVGMDTDAHIHNSTFSGNEAVGPFASGGAIAVLPFGGIVIRASTISENSATVAGGGIHHYCEGHSCPGKLVQGSIIYGNSAASEPDCSNGRVSRMASLGFNLVGPGCIHAVGPEDVVSELGGPLDPKLGPLQDNGGETDTHGLAADSPAIDHVPASYCTTETDQTGTRRRRGLGCEIGALEVPEPSPALLRLTSVILLGLLARRIHAR